MVAGTTNDFKIREFARLPSMTTVWVERSLNETKYWKIWTYWYQWLVPKISLDLKVSQQSSQSQRRDQNHTGKQKQRSLCTVVVRSFSCCWENHASCLSERVNFFTANYNYQAVGLDDSETWRRTVGTPDTSLGSYRLRVTTGPQTGLGISVVRLITKVTSYS